MSPFVSIIVPIYNAEKYLRECLSSLEDQTLSNIEVVMVDDVSTDGSRIIMQEFAAKDNRFKAIFNSENSKVSKTRNEGLEVATGEYVGFMDSDDYADPKMYEKMYNAATKNSVEIVSIGYHSVDDEGHKLQTVKSVFEEGEAINHDAVKRVISKAHVNKFLWFTWRNIYKRSLVVENNIRYDEDVSFGEDNIFNLYAFYHADGVFAINEPLYFYRNNPVGLSKSKVKPYLNTSTRIEYERKVEFYKTFDLWDECKQDLANYVSVHILPRLLINAKRSGQNLKEILAMDMIKQSLKNTSYQVESSLNIKLLVTLAKMNRVGMLRVLVAVRA